ncbi:iron complex transport system ATP-binding protein [Actinopolyspora lacussalsi subsp. righensis]|uniref:Iron complex transport system ATP-binding protein n=1 Tax=Actinopolyspora righensis TaxID=995060 RepID=A0A1I7B955_9ACTN|nr:ABC transporter ATP-binding protein [Actinopolyspora righensis]SFT83678.1 iron complex transport system ATP-binding protein [Actinopolyspora righensis]
MSLLAEEVSWRAGGKLIVDGVSIAPEEGATVGLLGPNGSGKSTLLRLLSGVRPASEGVIRLDGSPIERVGRKNVARRLAVVEQHAGTEVDMSVLDVVRLGRIPHRRAWAGATADDEAAVRSAVEYTRLEDKVERSWHTLSGGERQRVQIARALAQQPKELLLDEPTNHLDIQHQLELLALVVRIPVTSVIALHDLNLAAMFCDHLLVLAEGRAVAAGSPERVLTEELIAEVYNVRARVDAEGPGGRPAIRFFPD